jgi:hypothetical protein
MEFMFMNDMFMNDALMNDVGAGRNIHHRHRPSLQRTRQERPLAQGTSGHRSVKQFINCIEAHNQPSTCQGLRQHQD